MPYTAYPESECHGGENSTAWVAEDTSEDRWVIFHGTDAEARAREYAEWKNLRAENERLVQEFIQAGADQQRRAFGEDHP